MELTHEDCQLLKDYRAGKIWDFDSRIVHLIPTHTLEIRLKQAECLMKHRHIYPSIDDFLVRKYWDFIVKARQALGLPPGVLE